MHEQLLNDIADKYHKTHNPKGWVIGRTIAHYLSSHYSSLLVKHDGNYLPIKNELYGLPFIVDSENHERLEIIR